MSTDNQGSTVRSIFSLTDIDVGILARKHLAIFLGQFLPRQKTAMQLTLCETPNRETRPDHHTRNRKSYSLQQVCGFVNGDRAYS